MLPTSVGMGRRRRPGGARRPHFEVDVGVTPGQDDDLVGAGAEGRFLVGGIGAHRHHDDEDETAACGAPTQNGEVARSCLCYFGIAIEGRDPAQLDRGGFARTDDDVTDAEWPRRIEEDSDAMGFT